MRIVFSEYSWEEYFNWAREDRKVLQKINELIKDLTNNPFDGKGKPEPMKFNLSGCWSRRIIQEHRLVYKVEENKLSIISCRFQY
jgi:toxin YoeB